MSQATLLARLASIREKTDTSVTSEASTSTPLATLVAIYNKSGAECFTDYMQGAIAIHKWLSPISIPVIPTCKLPTSIPSMLCSYTIERISHMFYPISLVQGKNKYGAVQGMSSKEWFEKTHYIQMLVVYYTCILTLPN